MVAGDPDPGRDFLAGPADEKIASEEKGMFELANIERKIERANGGKL